MSEGEPVLFAEDVLVITPAPGSAGRDVVMQFRISGYSGRHGPPSDWQDAKPEMWKGEQQWCFTLPSGRMSVEVRARNSATDTPSKPSAARTFLVRGAWSLRVVTVLKAFDLGLHLL